MLIPFDFACNDDHGYYSGRVSAIHLPGGCLELDALDMEGPTFRPVRGKEQIAPERYRQRLRLQISRRQWQARHVCSHVGNIYWERFAIDQAERFVFWLRSCGLFTFDAGWGEIVDWWEQPAPTPFHGFDNDIERAKVRAMLLEGLQEDRL